jgi:hypothetical protein
MIRGKLSQFTKMDKDKLDVLVAGINDLMHKHNATAGDGGVAMMASILGSSLIVCNGNEQIAVDGVRAMLEAAIEDYVGPNRVYRVGPAEIVGHG